ncbi:LOW QUALITY PROTEIN: R3H domain containing-like [Channa argus]|uniref:LOW QUALITY PROTEIN: R3H domain containing-like n=1 Tax=Channa argus TaxID=215402 RepID=UPI003520F263
MKCSCLLLLHRAQMGGVCVQLLLAATMWMMNRGASGDARGRCKQTISPKEINALLDYHNRKHWVVYQQGHRLWDEGLARSTVSWASQCVWGHGSSQAMTYMGQNLSITSESCENLIFACTMVWGNSNRVGCAVRKCTNMHMF